MIWIRCFVLGVLASTFRPPRPATTQDSLINSGYAARLRVACPTNDPPIILRKAYCVLWSTELDDPIILPDGRQPLTLKDAATYITKLPKKESLAQDWQVAIEALMLSSRGGHAMLWRASQL